MRKCDLLVGWFVCLFSFRNRGYTEEGTRSRSLLVFAFIIGGGVSVRVSVVCSSFLREESKSVLGSTTCNVSWCALFWLFSYLTFEKEKVQKRHKTYYRLDVNEGADPSAVASASLAVGN